MKQLNWWKSIASFLVVLFTMPLGHALMMIMDKTMTPEVCITQPSSWGWQVLSW